MLRFFRLLRKKLLEYNNARKYFFYALGEIFLVVIGILIALSINNWNDGVKAQHKKQEYTNSLIDELELDLVRLTRLDSANYVYIQSLENYINYYNQPDKSIDSLVTNMKRISSAKNFFNTQTFTIEDLLSTGNLSLFDPKIRQGIIDLKQTQQINIEYERKSADNLIEFERAEFMRVDQFFEVYGEVPEHPEARGWKRDINSSIFRIHNNRVIEAHDFHNYQLVVHERIRVKTKELIELLQKELK